MKRLIVLCMFLTLCFSIIVSAQQPATPQQQPEQSRLLKLANITLTPAQKATLDSILHPTLDVANIKPIDVKSINTKDLILEQYVFPIKANIEKDTFGGTVEVLEWRSITKVVFNNGGDPEEVKKYKAKLNEWNLQQAARMREQAAILEKKAKEN